MKYILRLAMGCCKCCSSEDDNKKRKSIDGQEYVEFGGLKWATMNIGASKESEDGLYFAWGEIDGYSLKGKPNSWQNYKFFNTETNNVTKYNSEDGKTKLDLEDDAAYILWGGKWRMPTLLETNSLRKKSKWTVDYEGRSGFLYDDENGNLLFFPAATNTINPGKNYYNKQCCYWTSTRNSSLELNSAMHMHISRGTSNMTPSAFYGGFTIRPVWDDNLETVQIPFTHWYKEVLFRVSGTNLEAFKYQGQYMCISNGDIVLQDIDESVLTEALNIIKELNPDIKKVVTGDLRNYDKNRFSIDNVEKIESV